MVTRPPAPRRTVRRVAPVAHGGVHLDADGGPPVLDFSTAVNAFGPSAAVLEAIAAVRPDRYPDPGSTLPRRAAAEQWGRPIEEIAFGAGTSELIQALAIAFLKPGDRVVVLTPTYEEYVRAALLCGARVHAVWAGLRAPDGAIERFTAAVRRHRPRLAFLCVPNNPTGGVVSLEAIRAIAAACRSTGTLLVLDQSYDAFAGYPLGTPAAGGHPNVVHLRSITKDHALAGVRAGFAIAPPGVVRALEAVRAPWAASAYAQAAAVAALSPAGLAHLAATIPTLRAERRRMARALAELGVRVISGATHTLLIEVHDATATRRALLARHRIAVRDATSFGLRTYVRVAARTPAENDALLAALGTRLHLRHPSARP
jgi:histidinol-phosphate aminotransferase